MHNQQRSAGANLAASGEDRMTPALSKRSFTSSPRPGSSLQLRRLVELPGLCKAMTDG